MPSGSSASASNGREPLPTTTVPLSRPFATVIETDQSPQSEFLMSRFPQTIQVPFATDGAVGGCGTTTVGSGYGAGAGRARGAGAERKFAGDTGAQKLISVIALGAERIIANIPRGERLGRGRADSQSETVIIEWEKDLSRTGDHAREQLEEYLEGNWRSGQEYQYDVHKPPEAVQSKPVTGDLSSFRT